MPTVTVALTDVPAFAARFGVHLARVGEERGLPVCEWLPDAHQTPAQAAAWQTYLDSGAGEWRADSAQQAGNVAGLPERRPLAQMRVMAERIREALTGACLVVDDKPIIEIAGSVRREKPDVKDVEIVAVGDGGKLLALTDALLAQGVITHRLDKRGYKSYGPKYRRLMWGETPLDLFMVPLPEFGYTFCLRTGDADWSHSLVVRVDGFGYQRDGEGKPTGVKIPGLLPTDTALKNNRLHRVGWLTTETEAQLFEAYRLPFVPPQERNLQTVKRLAMVKK